MGTGGATKAPPAAAVCQGVAASGVLHTGLTRSRPTSVIVYEPNLSEPDFFGSEVVGDIDRFKTDADLIIANRATPELADVAAKIFTRDLFGSD